MATPIQSLDIINYPMTSKAVNAPIALTQAGVPGRSWHVCYANWRTYGAVMSGTSATVQIKDGNTVIYESFVTKNSVEGSNLSVEPGFPIKITEGNAVTYTISASGSASTGILANIGLMLR